ncbi:G2/M phase-specific E3 ubiquitin-protein ligase-like [Diadema setosum]|uniref:G2/M phase-specific E3 ubiquitin-protein ligase-like n=1 Tax=Diadema setosum TaxID=31175 RepID=UPI003B3A8891
MASDVGNQQREVEPVISGYQTAGTPTISFRLPPDIVDLEELPHVELSSTRKPEDQPSTITLEDILSTLGRQIRDDDSSNLISVTRDDILEGGFRGFKKPRFNPAAPLNVKFSGERGIDNKGLAREFLTLSLMTISDRYFSGGPAKSISIDYALMEDYEAVGKMMAYSIVHHGPPPSFFTKLSYEMICGGNSVERASLSDVTDVEAREAIQKILEADDSDYGDVTETHLELIEKSGCGRLILPHQKEKLVQSLIQFYAVDKHRAAVSKLQKGLETLGVLKAMRAHPTTMSQLFLYKEEKLTADQVEILFDVQYSPVGSNLRSSEERMVSYWRDLLEELEDEDGLESLLQFTTGVRRPPPLGFGQKLTLSFRHWQFLPEGQACTIQFPRANTCALELALPVVQPYELFTARVKAAVRAPLFFGIE